jgi:acyl-coenzyme A thioesterase PaaI-like protein
MRRDVPVVYGGPESLFRVEGLRVEGPTAHGSMAVGPWMTGPDGRIAAGSIAVLIDDVLGYATVAPQSPVFWSVSTDITLEVFPSLQATTSRLHATARAVHTDARGCFATGRVVNDDGDLVALCSERGRYVPLPWSEVEATPVYSVPPPDASDVMSLIAAKPSPTKPSPTQSGPAQRGGGMLIEVENSGEHQNVLGNLHGGISLCASDVLATMALTAPDQPLLATSSIRVAYSRPVPRAARIEYHAVVRHRGRSFGVVDVVGSIDGKPCTIAHLTAQPTR